MTRLVMMCLTSVLVLAPLSESRFNRLPSVETYEIRPGILMMPIYSNAGEVCRIVLEKRHVSSKKVDLDAEMSSDEISGVFDEVAPKETRGKPQLNLGDGGSITMADGSTFETATLYENVALRMYGKGKASGAKSYVAATIEWEKRRCK